jgi:hypothetical protein
MTVMATDAYGSSAPVNAELNVEKGGVGALAWWLPLLLLASAGRRLAMRPRG